MKYSTSIPGILSAALFLLLVSCGGTSDSAPSQLSRFPSDLKNEKVEVSGIYDDAWVEETGSATLQQPSGNQALTVRGMVPNLGNTNFTTTVELRLDDKSVGAKAVGPGDFQFSVPVPNGQGKRRVTLAFSPVQELPAGDGRMVGARLQFLGFEPASRKAAVIADIVRGPGVELGGGWGVVETFRGETFRWVDNDAQIRLTGGPAAEVTLAMLVEPGPGVGGKQFLLKVLDASGRQVAAVQVGRRSKVKFSVPIEAGKVNEFRLHVDGGGRAAKNDPRIMNFRVFEVKTG